MTRVVCLDPGHPSYYRDGNINYGAVSADGAREVEINLTIANIVQQILEKLGYGIVVTRNDNESIVDNVERIKIAAGGKVDLIVRLHCDQTSDRRPDKKGIRTFYPPQAAEKIYPKSLEAAKTIHLNAVKATNLFDNGLVDDTAANIDPAVGMLVGTKEANKYGIPAVLIEMVFLTNPEDVEWVTSPENQNRLAQGIAQGIDSVFQKGVL